MDVRSCWPRRHFPCSPPIPSGNIWKGSAASGLFEARLGHEEFGGRPMSFRPLTGKTNSMRYQICRSRRSQFAVPGEEIRERVMAGKSAGLRLNPECSTGRLSVIYDPLFARLQIRRQSGTWRAQGSLKRKFYRIWMDIIHTLCEQNSDAPRRCLRR